MLAFLRVQTVAFFLFLMCGHAVPAAEGTPPSVEEKRIDMLKRMKESLDAQRVESAVADPSVAASGAKETVARTSEGLAAKGRDETSTQQVFPPKGPEEPSEKGSAFGPAPEKQPPNKLAPGNAAGSFGPAPANITAMAPSKASIFAGSWKTDNGMIITITEHNGKVTILPSEWQNELYYIYEGISLDKDGALTYTVNRRHVSSSRTSYSYIERLASIGNDKLYATQIKVNFRPVPGTPAGSAKYSYSPHTLTRLVDK